MVYFSILIAHSCLYKCNVIRVIAVEQSEIECLANNAISHCVDKVRLKWNSQQNVGKMFIQQQSKQWKKKQFVQIQTETNPRIVAYATEMRTRKLKYTVFLSFSIENYRVRLFNTINFCFLFIYRIIFPRSNNNIYLKLKLDNLLFHQRASNIVARPSGHPITYWLYLVLSLPLSLNYWQTNQYFDRVFFSLLVNIKIDVNNIEISENDL